jgi:hypothetical protein
MVFVVLFLIILIQMIVVIVITHMGKGIVMGVQMGMGVPKVGGTIACLTTLPTIIPPMKIVIKMATTSS